MVKREKINVGDTIFIKSLICSYTPATITEITEHGVYVDDGSCCGTIFVEYCECFYTQLILKNRQDKTGIKKCTNID